MHEIKCNHHFSVFTYNYLLISVKYILDYKFNDFCLFCEITKGKERTKKPTLRILIVNLHRRKEKQSISSKHFK